jgi:hypothetical protein
MSPRLLLLRLGVVLYRHFRYHRRYHSEEGGHWRVIIVSVYAFEFGY